jgi:hypothetical protein
MPTSDRRELLEAVAYSDDPSVSTSDRLRALELLDKMPDPDENAHRLVAMVQGASTEELVRDLGAMLGGVVPSFAPAPEHKHPKREGAAIDAEVERRVQQRLRERRKEDDPDVIDGEVVAEPHQMAALPPGIEPGTPGFLNGSRDHPTNPADARAERRSERRERGFRI